MQNNLFIFDFFGVICNEITAAWCKKHCTPEKTQDLKRNLFLRGDLGFLNIDEVIAELAKVSGQTTEEVEAELFKTAKLNEKTLSLMQSLKEKHKVAVLSNAPRGSIEKLIPLENLKNFCHEIVISAHIGMAKPDPKIYEYVINLFREKFDNIFMIDDTAANLEPLEKMGITGILFTTAEEVEKQIKNFLE